jgi:hypothetical protein
LFTTLHYTFDIKWLPEELIKTAESFLSQNITLAPLPKTTQDILLKILGKWEDACEHQIKFQYTQNGDPQLPSITYASCDSSSAFTVWDYPINPKSTLNANNHALVCIPPNISTHWNLLTLSHETGHAIGIHHIHNVPSLKHRLLTSEQGLGCSVMTYANRLVSNHNSCTSPDYCLSQPYALFPGPWDKQICTSLFKVPSEPQVHYLDVVYKGFVIGAVEKHLNSILNNVAYQDRRLEKNTAKCLSVICATLLLIYLQPNFLLPGVFLILFELYARAYQEERAELIEFVRKIITIVSMVISLYTLYASEDFLRNGLYLLLFLASNFCGELVGRALGMPVSDLINRLIKNTCQTSPQPVDDAISDVPEHQPNLFHRFFSKRTWFPAAKDNTQQPTILLV